MIRDSTIIGDYALDTLRARRTMPRKSAKAMECGIKLAGFNDVKEGDVFEVYKVEEVDRTFDSCQ